MLSVSWLATSKGLKMVKSCAPHSLGKRVPLMTSLANAVDGSATPLMKQMGWGTIEPSVTNSPRNSPIVVIQIRQQRRGPNRGGRSKVANDLPALTLFMD